MRIRNPHLRQVNFVFAREREKEIIQSVIEISEADWLQREMNFKLMVLALEMFNSG